MLAIEQFMMFSGNFIIILMVWSLIWKGFALWKAARAGSKVWFIILLAVNTLGILEIIYIFAVKPRWNFSGEIKKDKTE